MENGRVEAKSQIKVAPTNRFMFPGEGKVCSHEGTISKIIIVQDNVELHLKGAPQHVWLGWPITIQPLSYVKQLSEGDRISIEFVQHGCRTLGVHKLLRVNKIV